MRFATTPGATRPHRGEVPSACQATTAHNDGRRCRRAPLRTGDLCAQGHKRICADTVHAHPVVRAPLWRDVLCSDYELRSASSVRALHAPGGVSVSDEVLDRRPRPI
jgi:hypothetical protein